MYICKDVYIRIENNSSLFTSGLSQGTVLKMPVSHGEGNYYIDDEGLRSLEENNQIAFRYSDAEGNITDEANFNGSRSEEHTSELQSRGHLVCRLLLEKKKT